ncbi:reverse transcriptase domain-containing protein [Tanacetum coccineum]
MESYDVMRLCLFPYSLKHHATAWFYRLPKNSIHSWEEMVTKFLSKYSPPSMVMKLKNDINTFYNGLTLRHRDTINTAAGDCQNEQNFLKMCQSNQQVNSVNPSCETCGGPRQYFECQATGGFTQGDVYAATGNYNMGVNQMRKMEITFNERPQDVLPSNTIPNPREDIKVITIQSGITLAGPSVPPHPPYSNERNPHQPPIPYPSRQNKDKLQDKSDIQIHKFLQMFKKLHFNISLVEALDLMPKCAKILKDLLTNKEKLLEMANTSLNENCSAVLLKNSLTPSGDIDFLLEETDALLALDDSIPFKINEGIFDPDPTPSSDSIIASPSPSLTPFGDSDSLLEETDAFLALNLIPLGIDNEIFDAERDILLLEKLLNIDSTKELPPQELNNDSEGDFLFF